jgi:hypothetical protein
MIQASHQKKRNVTVKSDVIRKNTTGIGIGKDVIEMTVIGRDRGKYESFNPPIYNKLNELTIILC